MVAKVARHDFLQQGEGGLAAVKLDAGKNAEAFTE